MTAHVQDELPGLLTGDADPATIEAVSQHLHECEQCRRGNFSVCERTNRNKLLADAAFGHTTAGLFGYTHLTGGYQGGQAE